MDILQLIDRLEELFNESKSIPLTRNVMVDEDRMLDIIDQMRIAIPEEVKKAQQLLGQRDRVLAQAQEEANRTLDLSLGVGLGDVKGKVFRIGHLGSLNELELLAGLAGVEMTLKRFGVPVTLGAGVAAAQSYLLDTRPR